MQIRNFSKIQSKILEKYFLKISLHFLANCYSTVNNEGGADRHFMQVQNLSKIRSKIFENYFFENISSLSYRGW